MLSIFVEASCNRYVRDECRFCHVYPPLKPILGSREDWHMMPDTARLMAEKIRSIVPLKDLAKKIFIKYDLVSRFSSKIAIFSKKYFC